ncbi:MAG TPA: DUF4878 domain-containing protein [Panacibacter sp.]|nr:DUF4878 domain-containing protein [Panacibacter sp.]
MQKIKCFIIIFLTAVLCGCSSGNNYARAEDPLDAAREFIDACLKGDFTKASFYMTDDARNRELLQKQEKSYVGKSKDEKQEYYNASIIIFEDAAINDATHIINYQNSYDKTGRKVKVILHNGTWQIDFKYTFDGNL